MEQIIFDFSDTVIQLRKNFTKNYNKFLDSALFWKISFFTIPIYLIEYTKFFTEINLYLGYIYSTISAFLLLVLLPPIYFKIKGRDFYNEMKKYFTISDTENSVIVVKPSENIEPFPDEFLNRLYEILKFKIFDKTQLPYLLQKDYDQFFSLEYFKIFLNDLKIQGTTKKSLYFSSNQKVAATIIFEVIKPLITDFNVTDYYQYFFYYKKQQFIKVKYNCLTSEKNKEQLPSLIKEVEDLKKNYDV